MTPSDALRTQLLIVRKQRRMTQRQVANDIGIQKLTVLRLEMGYVIPRPSTRRLIEMWIARNQQQEELELL